VAAVAVAGVVFGAAWLGVPGERPAPKPGERTAFTAVARALVPQADRAKYRVVNIKVSSRSRYWASAVLTPVPAYRSSLEGAYMILVRSAVSNRWTVLDLGTSGVGCTIAPISVLKDLGYAGECPANGRL